VRPSKLEISRFPGGRVPIGPAFLTVLLSFLAAGCATTPRYAVPILPAPAMSFPDVKPGLLRLPVDIVFPTGGGMVQHLSNFLKGGLRQFVPNLYGVPGLNLKAHIEELWTKMQQPIFLDKGLWLLIRPETLSIGMMRGDLKRASTTHADLEMTASPEIVFGPKPATVPKKMPALQRFQKGPGMFEAMTNTLMTYKEANQYFKDPRLKLIGMVMPGEQKVTLERIRMYGSGGKVVVEVKLHYNPPIINFTGKPAKLTVYFKGTPRYRPKERMFDMPDLDYDIKSNDLMVQVADFVFKDDFKKQFRGIAKLPIGPKIDIMQQKMEKALNRTFSRFVRIRTQVRSLRVLGGLANNEGIVARLSVRGTATMEVTWN